MLDLDSYDAPHDRLGGRSLAQVFASASGGCGADQRTMAELSMLAGTTGQIEFGASLLVAETWARQAIERSDEEAKMVLVNILLDQACLHMVDRRERALNLLAEAVSWLDELAAADHLMAARNMEHLLTNFVREGGTEVERQRLVAQARELREWRAR